MPTPDETDRRAARRPLQDPRALGRRGRSGRLPPRRRRPLLGPVPRRAGRQLTGSIAPEHPGAGESAGPRARRGPVGPRALLQRAARHPRSCPGPPLVGHSFGGMVAAEIAATNPERVDQLVLIAPIGLWLDDHPIPDISGVPPSGSPSCCSPTRTGPWRRCCRRRTRRTPRRCSRRRMTVASILQFIWPLPDKGLHKRLYRVKAPTLLVWGDPGRASSIRPTARAFAGGHRRRPSSSSSTAPATSRSSSRPRRRSPPSRPSWPAERARVVPYDVRDP